MWETVMHELYDRRSVILNDGYKSIIAFLFCFVLVSKQKIQMRFGKPTRIIN